MGWAYQEIVDLMFHSLKTAAIVYTTKKKLKTVVEGAWNVQHYFIVSSELKQSADKKK